MKSVHLIYLLLGDKCGVVLSYRYVTLDDENDIGFNENFNDATEWLKGVAVANRQRIKS